MASVFAVLCSVGIVTIATVVIYSNIIFYLNVAFIFLNLVCSVHIVPFQLEYAKVTGVSYTIVFYFPDPICASHEVEQKYYAQYNTMHDKCLEKHYPNFYKSNTSSWPPPYKNSLDVPTSPWKASVWSMGKQSDRLVPRTVSISLTDQRKTWSRIP